MLYIYYNRHFKLYNQLFEMYNLHTLSPLRWRRGSGLDCGSEDPGSIPCLPSPRGLMARRLKTSSDVPVPVSG